MTEHILFIHESPSEVTTFAGKFQSLEKAVEGIERFSDTLYFAIYKRIDDGFYDCSKYRLERYEHVKTIMGKKNSSWFPFSPMNYAFLIFDTWFFKSLP
jgi:hypothetical protein